MKSSVGSRSTTILKWFGSLLSVGLIIYLLVQQGWQEIGQALAQIPLWGFAVSVLLMIVSRFAVSNRWYALLRATDEDVNWAQSVRLTFAGLFATNFLPTTIGGDIVRLGGAVQYGMDGAVITASLVVDRLVGMFGMALMLPLGIIPMIAWMRSAQQSALSPLVWSLTLVQDSLWKKIWRKITQIAKKIFEALKYWWGHPRSLIESLAFTGIHMLCFFGIIWILFLGLDDPVPFGMVAGLYSFVYLVTLLPISINGYGLQELSISLIFSEVAGASLQHSLMVALIFRTLTMLASLPGAAFVPGIMVGQKRSRSLGEETAPLEADD